MGKNDDHDDEDDHDEHDDDKWGPKIGNFVTFYIGKKIDRNP